MLASPERRLVFDVNDFDETPPGPWEWDVKRLAVSMLIAARDNGLCVKDEERIVLDTVGRHRIAMAEFAGMKNLEVPPTLLGRRGKKRRQKCGDPLAAQGRTLGEIAEMGLVPLKARLAGAGDAQLVAAGMPSRWVCACWITGPGVIPSSWLSVVRARS